MDQLRRKNFWVIGFYGGMKVLIHNEEVKALKKSVICIAMAACLVVGVIGGTAFGSSTLTEIQAYLNAGLKFKLNGADWYPKDTNGSNMLPITYNGSTYVPLRAVSTALKVPVTWDGPNNTVVIGSDNGGKVALDNSTISLGTDSSYRARAIMDTSQLAFGGKVYSSAFVISELNSATQKIDITVGKPYSKGHFVFAANGGDVQVSIQNKDGLVFKDVTVKKGAVSEVDFNISNIDKDLYISATGPLDGLAATFYLMRDDSWVQ
jgi:hypothetical protein